MLAYKHYHKKYAVERKVEFLSEVKHIRHQTFKRSTIKTAFRKAGLWPLNPHEVLNKLPPLPREQTLEEIPFRSLSPPTPFTPVSTYKFATKILESDHPYKPYVIQRYVLGSYSQIRHGEVVERDLKAARSAAAERQK